jgi:chromosome segregation ATPase
MPQETSQTAEVDLEKTDRLPALEMAASDEGFADDAVPLEYPAGGPVASRGLLQSTDFARASGLDLPSLAETVRSVEERIARQNAAHEALERDYHKALDAESAAVARANGLAVELGSLRSALEAQQKRALELEDSLDERTASVESARNAAEHALRDAEKLQAEARSLKESLAARDAHIQQVLHSLSERDALLLSLQTEHARIIPELEERYRTGSQLESDLHAVRSRAAALDEELSGTKSNVVSLSDQIKRREAELAGARAELEALKQRSLSYLETLRSRDWQHSFHLNGIREKDAELAAAQADIGVLRTERDGLKDQVARLTAEIGAHRLTIAELHGQVDVHAAALVDKDAELRGREQAHAAALVDRDRERDALAQAHAVALAAKDQELRALEQERDTVLAQVDREKDALQQVHATALAAKDDELHARDQVHADLRQTIAGLEAELTRLTELVAARDATIEATRASGGDEARRLSGLLEAAEDRARDREADIARLQAELEAAKLDCDTLAAHLLEARRPVDVIEAEVQRLTAELAAMAARGTELEGENAKLRSSLERTRGALEEREFLIRRLERSESNNANVLGRIQTSIERLGVVPPAPVRSDPARADLSRSDIIRGEAARTDLPRADAARVDLNRSDIARVDLARVDMARVDMARVDMEWVVDFVRIDGGKSESHLLGKRTRVGRATGCELHVDSSSVSRHHALILVGPRDIIIEDLNSTNGVYINGRKASRQVLNDGDTLTIGEAIFRISAKQQPRRE